MFSKIIRIFSNSIFALLVFFGVMISLTFLPFDGKIRLYTVLSGSMEPKIHTGSMIFVRPVDTYGVGDIVTRMTDERDETITHRIVAKNTIGDKTVFQTKGDANTVADNEEVMQDMIVGKVFLTVPYMGFFVNFAKTTPGMIMIFVIPATIIVYEEIGKIKKEITHIVEKRRAKRTSVPEHEDAACEYEFAMHAMPHAAMQGDHDPPPLSEHRPVTRRKIV